MPIIDPAYLDPTFLCRAAGLLGVMLYVTSFLCLSTGRLHSNKPTYFVLVLTAALLVMVSLTADFNLSAALIQGFYIIISVGGILLRMCAHRRMARTGNHGYDPAIFPSGNY